MAQILLRRRELFVGPTQTGPKTSGTPERLAQLGKYIRLAQTNIGEHLLIQLCELAAAVVASHPQLGSAAYSLYKRFDASGKGVNVCADVFLKNRCMGNCSHFLTPGIG